MSEYFKPLSENEKSELSDALALITVLIAGADGNFEKEELEWAEKVTHIRSYK
jgi:tellurite resistance protein